MLRHSCAIHTRACTTTAMTFSPIWTQVARGECSGAESGYRAIQGRSVDVKIQGIAARTKLCGGEDRADAGLTADDLHAEEAPSASQGNRS